nr:mobilization protein [Escherichia coli]
MDAAGLSGGAGYAHRNTADTIAAIAAASGCHREQSEPDSPEGEQRPLVFD